MMTNRGKRLWIFPVLMSFIMIAGMVPLAFGGGGSNTEGGPPIIEDSGQDVDTVFSGPAIVASVTLSRIDDINAYAIFSGRCGSNSSLNIATNILLGDYRPPPDGTQILFSNLTADDLSGYVFTLSNANFNRCFPRVVDGFLSGKHYVMINTVLNFDRSEDGSIITANVVVLNLLPR